MTLRRGDLKNLIYNVIEIDSFKSKMGSDENIVTISISVKTKEAADDLVGFFEKGYNFILDADATPGEQADGTYKVFVEMERNSSASRQIVELIEGVKNLTDLDEIRFRYYKSFKSQPLTQESLDEMLPNDPSLYDIMINESRLENYKHFFSKSYIDSIDMIEDTLRIKKIYADPLEFEFLDFGNSEVIQESIQEKINVNDFAEIIYLSKYIGDYNIIKYGNKLVLENQGKSLLVKRINR